MAQAITAEEQQRIEQLHTSMTSTAELAAADLCSIWSTVEPYWGTIIAIVAKIPFVGKTIAALLGAFGKALDVCCPTQQESISAAESASDAERRELESAFSAVFGEAAGEKPCCNIWKKIKPYWGTILAIVKKIPGVGMKLADILTKLGNALDQFCG